MTKNTLLAVLGALVSMPGSTAAQDARGVLEGRVLGSDGHPVAGVAVFVREMKGLGTVTTADGTFQLRVPLGEWTVQAETIAQDSDLQLVSFEREGSARIEFRLGERAVPLDGTDWPLPEQPLLDEAARIVLDLLQQDTLKEFVREHISVTSDTVSVLMPWWPGPQATEGEGPYFRLMSDCSDCVDRPVFSLEGGGRYMAGHPHLRIGVQSYQTGTPRMAFCVGAALPGATLLPNCAGPLKRMDVHYVYLGGEWRMMHLR